MNKFMLIKFISGQLSRIDRLRILVMLGFHGRAYQYAEHVYLHYNDHTYMEREEFYKLHKMDHTIVW